MIKGEKLGIRDQKREQNREKRENFRLIRMQEVEIQTEIDLGSHDVGCETDPLGMKVEAHIARKQSDFLV